MQGHSIVGNILSACMSCAHPIVFAGLHSNGCDGALKALESGLSLTAVFLLEFLFLFFFHPFSSKLISNFHFALNSPTKLRKEN